MNKLSGIALFLACSLLASSCSLLKGKGHKSKSKIANITTDTTAIAATTVQPAVAPSTIDSVAANAARLEEVAPLWQKRLQYHTFSGKAKVSYEGGGNSQEFTANFRVKKDSVIWIAITGLGGLVPVARIYITPDSFYMVNMLEREVTTMPLSQAAKLLPTPVEFSSLQNLIVGEPLRDGKIVNASNAGDQWVLDIADGSYLQRIAYGKTDSTMRSAQLRTINNSSQAVTQFDGYETIRDRKLSTHRVINLKNGNDTYLVDMNFVNSDFDQALEFPFSIPKNYKVKK
jgi:hypothetical protein